MTVAFHPYAEIFPLFREVEFAELIADVRQFGVREKIKLLDGQILDGRNRYRACLAVGLLNEDDDPVDHPNFFERFAHEIDGEPLAYVISRNLKRRHLNDDQRRVIAAKLVNMGRGRPSENPAFCGIKVADAAHMMNTDKAGTERARTVLARATPEICTAVEYGKLSVAAAGQASKLDPEKQRRIAEQAEAGKISVVKTVIKQEARAERERQLGERQLAEPEGKFGVMVEDYE
jgi:hypothetical protein